MKKIFITILISAFFIHTIDAQITLTYKTHGLQGGDIHITQKADYGKSGKAGEKILWDFSDMQCSVTKHSYIDDAFQTQGNAEYPGANIAIGENDKQYFFEVDEFSNRYVGMMTQNSIITFDQPVVKMKYPFTYGDNFSGEFTGKGIYGGVVPSDIKGKYSVEADGYGTLLLPNRVVNNALRVKSVTQLDEYAKCTYAINRITKYLWYAEGYRYPVLVVFIHEKTTPDGTETSKSAYYNEKVFASRTKSETTDVEDYLNTDYAYNLFPNPFSDHLKIRYELTEPSNVDIRVFDMTGKQVEVLMDKKNMDKGFYTNQFDAAGNGLKPGTYLVKLEFNGKSYLEKVVLLAK